MPNFKIKACRSLLANSFARLGGRRYAYFSSDTTVNESLSILPEVKKAQSYNEIINHHYYRILNLSKNGKKDEEADKLYDFSKAVIDSMKKNESLKIEDQNDVLNNIITKFASLNFASASLAFKQLNESVTKKTYLKPESLVAFITYNPGRVKSSWEIFKETCEKDFSDSRVVATVLKKLIQGDAIDKREGAAHVDISRASKIFKLLMEKNGLNLIEESDLAKLACDLIDIKLSKALVLLKLPVTMVKTIIGTKGEHLSDIDYYYLYLSAKESGESIPPDLLLDIMLPISRLQTTEGIENNTESFKNLQSLYPFEIKLNASPSELVKDIRSEVYAAGLANTIRVRLDLIRSAGMHSHDVEKALEYISDKPQTLLSKQDEAVLKNAKSMIKIYNAIDTGKSLADSSEKLPDIGQEVNIIASKILLYSWFGDSDRALDLYNKSLNLYLKPKKDVKNAKARGKLLQSLVLSSLLDNELQMARLIKIRCTENKLLDDEYDIKISQILKSFGSVSEESKGDKNAMRKGLKTVIFDTIEDMYP